MHNYTNFVKFERKKFFQKEWQALNFINILARKAKTIRPDLMFKKEMDFEQKSGRQNFFKFIISKIWLYKSRLLKLKT